MVISNTDWFKWYIVGLFLFLLAWYDLFLGFVTVLAPLALCVFDTYGVVHDSYLPAVNLPQCSLTRQTKNCKSFLKVASSDLGCVTQLWLKDPSLPTAQLFDVSRIHSCSEHSTWSLIDHVLGNNKQADILKKYIPCEFIPFPYI